MYKLFLLLIAFSFLWYTAICQETEKPTIPIEKKIKVFITEIDSSTLFHYNIYQFNYQGKKAEFWASKSDKIFLAGKAKVKLCRIIQMKTENGNSRGCAFYNGLIISDNDTIIKHYKFDEFGEYPTLRLCSTDD